MDTSLLQMIGGLAGGIGLFLLGMILMTDGLRDAAGNTLDQVLRQFTDGKLRAIGSGATITALVQSSSATTVTTIGFVSAGLMTFPQALGVILGANLGSTSTGWIVGLLGLQLSIGVVAQPLIVVGALMRLLGRGTVAHAGMALAGFGVLFVGIDVLQMGTASLAAQFQPEDFPDDTWFGRLLLVGIGALMTVLMQSSSAAVATTLTALYSGAIGLEQAAALVIGQNLGTTVKAALVSIGASVPAKRTALAHILFNSVTAVVAFALLPLFAWSVRLLPEITAGDAALIIALFHTLFNVLGILLFLPVLHSFARIVERMIPEKLPNLTRHLDDSVTETPQIASQVARKTVANIADVAVRAAARVLAGHSTPRALEVDVERCQLALRETRYFLSKTPGLSSSEETYAMHVSTMHALDHLERLLAALQSTKALEEMRTHDTLSELIDLARRALTLPDTTSTEMFSGNGDVVDMKEVADELAKTRRTLRSRTLDSIAAGDISPNTGLRILEAARWLDRAVYHTWRIQHHLRIVDIESHPDADEEYDRPPTAATA